MWVCIVYLANFHLCRKYAGFPPLFLFLISDAHTHTGTLSDTSDCAVLPLCREFIALCIYSVIVAICCSVNCSIFYFSPEMCVRSS